MGERSGEAIWGPRCRARGGLGPLCLSGGQAQVYEAEAGARWECRGAKRGAGAGNEIHVLRRACPQHHGQLPHLLSAHSWPPVGATHHCLVPALSMDVLGISR